MDPPNPPWTEIGNEWQIDCWDQMTAAFEKSPNLPAFNDHSIEPFATAQQLTDDRVSFDPSKTLSLSSPSLEAQSRYEGEPLELSLGTPHRSGLVSATLLEPRPTPSQAVSDTPEHQMSRIRSYVTNGTSLLGGVLAWQDLIDRQTVGIQTSIYKSLQSNPSRTDLEILMNQNSEVQDLRLALRRECEAMCRSLVGHHKSKRGQKRFSCSNCVIRKVACKIPEGKTTCENCDRRGKECTFEETDEFTDALRRRRSQKRRRDMERHLNRRGRGTITPSAAVGKIPALYPSTGTQAPFM